MNIIDESTSNGDQSLQSTLLRHVIHEICAKLSNCGFDARRDLLRIDIHPKCYNEEVFTVFNERDTSNIPIQLARSASKVSHVVNIIIHSTTVSISNSDHSDAKQCTTTTMTTSIQNIYWGISTREEHFEKLNHKLNDHATAEVVMEPTCPQTGLDCCANGALLTDMDAVPPWDAPVSRAYYKLAQVFDDDDVLRAIASACNNSNSAHLSKESILSHGSAMDIGASPGGWTQVLSNTLKMPAIISIDPGLLAKRVTAVGDGHVVQHVRHELHKKETTKFLARHAPYSAIVCDASRSNASELLNMISDTLEKVLSVLRNPGDTTDDGPRQASSSDRGIFAYPMCLVVTLKLPYKTEGSIERNLEKTKYMLPGCLQRIASLGSLSSSGSDDEGCDDIEVVYRICHTFANSTSERTLIAIFSKK